LLKQVPGLPALVRAVRARFDPVQRSLKSLGPGDAARLLQPSNVTREDRWPAFFSFIQSALAGVEHPRILSFGCATGEEVFTLRRYFPHAELVGIDINPHNISQCQAKLRAQPDAGIQFKRAACADEEPAASFDAIFCMAVLRHGALGEVLSDRCDAYVRFDDIDALVAGLARSLKRGGYLAIWSSHFRFADMSVAAEFDVVLQMPSGAHFNTPLYGPDNRRLLGGSPYCEAIFRKR